MMAGPAPTFTFPSGLLALMLPAGTALIRIHRLIDGPVWFGPRPGAPPQYRFDAPGGEFRTLYAAQSLTGAFVETVLRSSRRIVAPSFVNDRGWTAMSATRSLKLAQIFDRGLVWHGVDAAICSANSYANSQALALALYSAFPDLDGLAYRARHNNGEICYALFDRVLPTDIVSGPLHPFVSHRSAIDPIIRAHGAAWDTTPAI
jgi:RES domain